MSSNSHSNVSSAGSSKSSSINNKSSMMQKQSSPSNKTTNADKKELHTPQPAAANPAHKKPSGVSSNTAEKDSKNEVPNCTQGQKKKRGRPKGSVSKTNKNMTPVRGASKPKGKSNQRK